MKIRIAFTTVLAAALFVALPATYASTANMHSPVHALFSNGQKNIKFSLRNDTGVPLELKVGDKVETLQVGQVMPFKLPVGTRITTNTATEHYHVGDLIVEVTASMYSDSTITIGK